jgi:hypothetical protein
MNYPGIIIPAEVPASLHLNFDGLTLSQQEIDEVNEYYRTLMNPQP